MGKKDQKKKSKKDKGSKDQRKQVRTLSRGLHLCVVWCAVQTLNMWWQAKEEKEQARLAKKEKKGKLKSGSSATTDDIDALLGILNT
jgi:hypothetical protein